MEKNSWRVFGLALLGGCLGAMLTTRLMTMPATQAESAVVRGQRFELVDGSGRTVAIWAIDRRNDAVLAFVDATGNPRAELGVSLSSLSPRLVFRDADGRLRVSLTTDNNGKPALNMGDEVRESRLLLGYLPNDSPGPRSDAWGLVLPKMGALSAWASIGVLRDPVSGTQAGHVSVVDRNGKTWREPR